jgi:hypothetical protein
LLSNDPVLTVRRFLFYILHSMSRRLILRYVSAALADNPLSIRPLLELIADYADFVGSVRTLMLLSTLPIEGRSGEFRGLTRAADGSLVIADCYDRRISRFDVSESAGSDPRNILAGFDLPLTAICADPSRPGCYFVTTDRSIEYFVDDSLRRIAGGVGCRLAEDETILGPVDGIGIDARFSWIGGCVCTVDGSTLFVTDFHQNSIRQVDVKTGSVRTVGQAIRPRKITVYRSPATAADSVLFAAALNSVVRFDTKTAKTTTLVLSTDRLLAPLAIVCTAAGILIISCATTYCLYAVDPSTAETVRIAGVQPDYFSTGVLKLPPDGDNLTAAGFRSVEDICLDDASCRAWTIENRRLRVVDLPPHLFHTDRSW